MTAHKAQRTPKEKVRVLQRKLYRAAKAQPQRTFGVLYDKVCSREVLWVAWEQVRRNRGAPGIDGETVEAIEAKGVEQFLCELQMELLEQRYRPQPVRRVFIPKPDGRQRPLGIPGVKDRVAQAAVRIVIEPLFEASFRPGSYGFRPKRGARQAIYDIRKWVTYGYDKVIDLDLKSYFDTIDHDLLMKLVQRRVRDTRVLRLIRRWLRAGVMLEGTVADTVIGAPQGAVMAPRTQKITFDAGHDSVGTFGRRAVPWSRGQGNAVAVDLVIADEDFLDEKPQDALAFRYVEGIRRRPKSSEERGQRFSQAQVGCAIE